jgi:general secretion pathway protein B
MSYILDALKKSEQDRQRRRPAGLDTIYEAELQKPKRNMHWAYLIACALILNAALLLWWLRPWSRDAGVEQNEGAAAKEQAQIATGISPPPPAVSTKKPGTGVTQKQEKQGKNGSQDKPVPHTAEVPVEKIEKQAGGAEQPSGVAQNTAKEITPPSPTVLSDIAHKEEVKSVPESVPKPEPARVADAVPVVKAPPGPAPLAARVQEPARVTAAPASENPVKKEHPKTPAADAGVSRPNTLSEQPNQVMGGKELVSDLKTLTGSEKPAAKGAGTDATARLQDLPSSVRNSLPAMSVSMLIYSAKPVERYININGSRMHEGQEVSAGLKVEEITPDGAVFSYQGYRFYKAVIGD